MPSSSIPVIDISSIVNSTAGHPSQTLIAEWDAALRSVGFAIIVGHGMEPAIVDELYAKAKQFFASTIEEKLKYRKNQFYGSGGYTPIGMEAASRSIQDRHEANSGQTGYGYGEGRYPLFNLLKVLM
jgi:isopenicillin N synthase-like dioxygenase